MRLVIEYEKRKKTEMTFNFVLSSVLDCNYAKINMVICDMSQITVDCYRHANECLDWQPSQFINIVGKDDVARSGSGGGGEVPADPRHSLPVGREDQPSHILPSHSETFYPPTHPRIVTASGCYW
jgi:hypothetical protein